MTTERKNSLLLFGEYLVGIGALSKEHLIVALTTQIYGNLGDDGASERVKIGQLLVRLEYLTQEEMEAHLAKYHELCDKSHFPR